MGKRVRNREEQVECESGSASVCVFVCERESERESERERRRRRERRAPFSPPGALGSESRAAAVAVVAVCVAAGRAWRGNFTTLEPALSHLRSSELPWVSRLDLLS
ncbi:unnamed protein product [Gadus morhua 'NCC']